MSNFTRYTGYIYPLPQMTDEERFEYLGKVNEEATFDLDADKFMTEQLGDNNYLLWVTSSSYGKESGEFGKCRPCNQQEIYYHAPKFRDILGEIDTKKLKFIDYCYYNSTECTVDYYLEEEYNDTNFTLQQAIAEMQDFAKETPMFVGSPKAAKIAEYLQELVDSRIKIKRLETELKAEHQQAINTANELAAYKDKTLITADFLSRNKFELQKVQNGIDKEPQPEYIYCNDAIEISAELRDEERGIWRVWINFLDECCPTDLDICTVGELRMFISIEGLNEIAQQFK